MKHKTFKYKNYEGCYFFVSTYLYNHQAMAISIITENNEDEIIVTVNMKDYLYYPNVATIKNYSENSGMTTFLKELGIIKEIFASYKCNPYACEGETIDYCLIDMDKLKEYTKDFEYEYEF